MFSNARFTYGRVKEIAKAKVCQGNSTLTRILIL